MKAVLSLQKAILTCAMVLLSLTFTAWQDHAPRTIPNTQDTVPPKREKKIIDLDEALAELDEAHEQLERSLKDVDWENVQADMKAALKNMDVELKEAQVELQKSVREIDVEKLRHDMEASVAKIDWNEIKQQIERVKTVDLEKIKDELKDIKVELENLKPVMEESLQEARESIEKAKGEIGAYKRFVGDLERDGLIEKGKRYKIEHKDGQLFINGKQQPAAVYNKYRTFLESKKTFTLDKNREDFSIDND